MYFSQCPVQNLQCDSMYVEIPLCFWLPDAYPCRPPSLFSSYGLASHLWLFNVHVCVVTAQLYAIYIYRALCSHPMYIYPYIHPYISMHLLPRFWLFDLIDMSIRISTLIAMPWIV